MENYKKEFNLNFNKKYYFYILLPFLIGIFIPALLDRNILSNNEIIMTIFFVILIFSLAAVFGNLLAYKKVTFLYCKNTINIAFEGGYWGFKNNQYCINILDIEQYKERRTYRGYGYMQFIMKDTSIIEIAYSPYLTTYTNLRTEILDVLAKNNIKTTCSL